MTRRDRSDHLARSRVGADRRGRHKLPLFVFDGQPRPPLNPAGLIDIADDRDRLAIGIDETRAAQGIEATLRAPTDDIREQLAAT